MAAGHHLDGVPLEQLMLVRVQSGLENARCDGRGRLVLSRVGSGREDSMNTFHFALNGVVTNHVLGRFDSPVAVVAPLARTCWDLGQSTAAGRPRSTRRRSGRPKLLWRACARSVSWSCGNPKIRESSCRYRCPCRRRLRRFRVA